MKIIILDPAKNISQMLPSDFAVLGQTNSADEFILMCKNMRPDMGLINMDKTAEILSRAENTKLPYLIGVADRLDANYLRWGVDLKVHDMLVRPLETPQLNEVLERAIKNIQSEKAKQDQSVTRRTKTICIFSSKGGVGKSTLSVNLAAALSEGQAQKICVLDLNQRQGSIPLLLDLAPQHTLSDFLVDETHMEKEATSSYSENLMVIAASKDYETLDPTKLQKFVERLHGQYDYVLIDCENRLQGSTLTVLDQADMILYPITLDIPAVRNAFQDLEIFKKLYYTPEKLKIVINEIHPNKELLLPEIEKHLHWKIFATLPHGGSELVESLDMGKPLVVTNPQNSYSQAITQLMQSLNMKHARR